MLLGSAYRSLMCIHWLESEARPEDSDGTVIQVRVELVLIEIFIWCRL